MPDTVRPRAQGRVSRLAAAAVCAPMLATLLLAVYVVAGWVAGTDPFWPTPELNVAEAALVRDHAEVVRLIQLGHDPNRSWPVRADVNDGRAATMTPLEAAIRIRRLELVELLLRHGARVTPVERPGLIELAKTSDAPDIAEYLEALAVE